MLTSNSAGGFVREELQRLGTERWNLLRYCLPYDVPVDIEVGMYESIPHGD